MIELVSLELTNACAKACWFCYNHSQPAGRTRWAVADGVPFVRDCAGNGVAGRRPLSGACRERPLQLQRLQSQAHLAMSQHQGSGHHNLETVLGKGDRLNQTLKKDRLGGVDCYVIAFDTKNKQRYEYWAAPGKDYALLRISVTNALPDSVGQGLVENELERFGPGGVWFPKTSTCTSSIDGNPPVAEGSTRVSSESSNLSVSRYR